MPIDFGTILTSLQAARSTAEKYSDLPLKSALLELYDRILSAREEALSLQEELHASRRRVLELEEALSERAKNPRDGLVFDRGVWWGSERREHTELGPYCAKCIDDGERRLLKPDRRGSAVCMKCEQWFHSILPRELADSPTPPARNWLSD